MRSSSQHGFSLLEILVVMTIMAVLTGTVVLGATGADKEKQLKGIAERIAIRIEHARQYALQRNTEWGVRLDGDDYRFVEFDAAERKWVEQDYRPFVAERPQVPVRFYLNTEGIDLERYGKKDLPGIVLFSHGEATPFSWRVEGEWETDPWWINNDGLSATTVDRERR
ncbi:MAG: type II secretion system minor pseudopilin GspH [Pseudomonadales bacterium]|nr:type II secretion system minor pseudopilin GspH [Pseudomonadales bacterium]MDP6473034.1 type II secretion system minor pseudopilin GspH [Pseudomonadales bacterium]MDP6826209.1 type II secretion system minor pseudopilin GspH [Pseudomonadales bacterium]MDP6973332.1 type II secretion system minor pseudopilin GspH [Pseudomonadales bacterium]